MQSIKRLISNEKKAYSQISKANTQKLEEGVEVSKEDQWAYHDSRAKLYELKSICANTDTEETREWDEKHHSSRKHAQDLVSKSFAETKEMKRRICEYNDFFKDKREEYQELLNQEEKDNRLDFGQKDLREFTLRKKMEVVEDAVKKLWELFPDIKRD